MTIQDLGSAGELVAAIATVVTLAYLARQIRQSNRSNQLLAVTRLAEGTEAWLGQILRDAEVYDIYWRGMHEPEALTQEQRGRFELLIVSFLRSMEVGWLQVEWGLVDPSYWEGFRESLRFIVGSKGGKRALERSRGFLTPAFAEAVDEILELR
jgi:hypothetical protein